jgi:hypothetical protein
LGFKTATEIGDEELTTIFEFELFGVGARKHRPGRDRRRLSRLGGQCQRKL